jgi:ABC-type branched-subunit amino acid transport system substrate-binding protein
VRRPTSIRAVVAVMALAAATLAACSGAPRPQALRTDGGARAGDGAGGDAGAAGGVTDTVPGDTDPGAAAAATAGTTGVSTAGPAGATKSAGTSNTGAGPGSNNTRIPAAPQAGDATLYSGAPNTRGITDKQISLCGHAALIFGQAFDTKVEDLNVYWEQLNAGPKIHGRTVSAHYEDDRYDGPAARDAAIACRARNPFMILGGIGFDQIPTVRQWAEDNKELYLHHIAVAKGGENMQYSFTPQPSVEDVGTAFGDYIVNHHKDKTVGIIWRESENWQPGRDNGKKVLAANGVKVVADAPVQKNQSAYSSQIVAMQQADGGKGAKVVWIWENALGAAQFIQQAWNQGYYPTFVVFPFQTTLDVVAKGGLKSPIEGVGSWSSYKPGGYGGLFPEHDYEGEIKRFEQAMAKFRPGVKPNDILWQVWLANKQLHAMLDACGPTCTRNRFAGMMLNGYHARTEPNCDLDFSRGNHHRGGWEYTTMLAYATGGDSAAYKTTQWCSQKLG